MRPTLTLAGTTAALSVGVGFLPVLGTAQHHGPVVTGVPGSVLAATAALLQPRVGAARDAGRISDRTGMVTGLAVAAAGFVLAASVPGLGGLFAAAIAVGAGTPIAAPLAFAQLASTTPPERMGQTMGAAEVGRELGDAGGPLLVGAVAVAATLDVGLVTLAVVLLILATVVLAARSAASGGRAAPH